MIKEDKVIYRIYKDLDETKSSTILGAIYADVSKEEYDRWIGVKEIVSEQQQLTETAQELALTRYSQEANPKMNTKSRLAQRLGYYSGYIAGYNAAKSEKEYSEDILLHVARDAFYNGSKFYKTGQVTFPEWWLEYFKTVRL